MRFITVLSYCNKTVLSSMTLLMGEANGRRLQIRVKGENKGVKDFSPMISDRETKK